MRAVWLPRFRQVGLLDSGEVRQHPRRRRLLVLCVIVKQVGITRRTPATVTTVPTSFLLLPGRV